MSLDLSAGRCRHLTISAIGALQVLAWGSSYYLPAVLAAPIARNTGWPLAGIVAGLSLGLLVSGLAAPTVGRTIQRRGGRLVLAASSMLLASGLLGLALAPSLPLFLAAWVVLGLGMSCGLYDAAFATAGRLYGREARSSITTLTLWGGFASTVCWPVSAYLVETVGWREACLVYAGVHLLIGLPLHWLAVPALPAATTREGDGVRLLEKPADVPGQTTTFLLLAAILMLAALTASMMSVHLLTVLQLRGYELAAAVALGALIGPSQVGARVVEMLLGRHYHPAWTMLLSVALIGGGIALLLFHLPLPGLALVLYGAGNGIHTIARGALPLVLFNPAHYAVFMGRLALPSLIVQALAPSVGTWLLAGDGTLMLAALAAIALVNIALGLALARRRQTVAQAHPAALRQS